MGDEIGDRASLLASDLILMQHMERVAGLPHLDAGEAPPCSAHRIESASLESRHDRGSIEVLRDDFACLDDRAAGHIHEAQRSQGKGDALTNLAGLDVDELETAAAEIADQPVGVGDARHDAHG